MSELNDFVSNLKWLITEYEQLKAISEAENADSERLNRIIVCLLLQSGGAVTLSDENFKRAMSGTGYTFYATPDGVVFEVVNE